MVAELMYLLRKSLAPEKTDPFFEKAIEQAGMMGTGVKEAEIKFQAKLEAPIYTLQSM